jgi:hypothetical protein
MSEQKYKSRVTVFSEYQDKHGKESIQELCNKVGIKIGTFYHLRLGYRLPSYKLAKKFHALDAKQFPMARMLDE